MYWYDNIYIIIEMFDVSATDHYLILWGVTSYPLNVPGQEDQGGLNYI